jgi:hypothetical protein
MNKARAEARQGRIGPPVSVRHGADDIMPGLKGMPQQHGPEIDKRPGLIAEDYHFHSRLRGKVSRRAVGDPRALRPHLPENAARISYNKSRRLKRGRRLDFRAVQSRD